MGCRRVCVIVQDNGVEVCQKILQIWFSRFKDVCGLSVKRSGLGFGATCSNAISVEITSIRLLSRLLTYNTVNLYSAEVQRRRGAQGQDIIMLSTLNRMLRCFCSYSMLCLMNFVDCLAMLFVIDLLKVHKRTKWITLPLSGISSCHFHHLFAIAKFPVTRTVQAYISYQLAVIYILVGLNIKLTNTGIFLRNLVTW